MTSGPIPTDLGRALDRLTKAKDAPAAPKRQPNKPPTGFSPLVDVEAGKSAVVVTQGSPIDGPQVPDRSDQLQIIADNGLDPEQWTVVSWRRATWQRYDGEWLESFRATMVPRNAAQEAAGGVLPDLDDLHRMVRRDRRKNVPSGPVVERAMVVSLSDLQVGKTDARGGTQELLERLEASRELFREHAKRLKPSRIILLDGGDGIENFESTGSEDRTNDLSLTEQIRVLRRQMWSWVETAAASAPSVAFGGVGSNHCRVRRGKNSMGTPSDDFGVEVVAQLADMASVYPEKYGHVSFHTPGTYDEGLLLPLPGGKSLGLVHGHQVSNIDKIPDWWGKQAFGRTPVGTADYLVSAHFHHLRVQTVGDGRWWFATPTADNGSSWFRNISGTESDPGVLSFCVESDGSWGNLAVL